MQPSSVARLGAPLARFVLHRLPDSRNPPSRSRRVNGLAIYALKAGARTTSRYKIPSGIAWAKVLCFATTCPEKTAGPAKDSRTSQDESVDTHGFHYRVSTVFAGLSTLRNSSTTQTVDKNECYPSIHAIYSMASDKVSTIWPKEGYPAVRLAMASVDA